MAAFSFGANRMIDLFPRASGGGSSGTSLTIIFISTSKRRQLALSELFADRHEVHVSMVAWLLRNMQVVAKVSGSVITA